jgi:hypothetical protein
MLALLLLGIASALIARVFIQNIPDGVVNGVTALPTATERPAMRDERGAKPSTTSEAKVTTQRAASSPALTAPNADHSDASARPTSPISEPTAQQRAEISKIAPAPPSIGFAQEEYTVSATSSVARLTIKRSGSLDKETIFHWRTVGGSARPERDYVSFDDAADRFAPGQRNAQILVPIVNDSQRRGTEYFDVEITDATTASLGSVVRATVVIVSED